MGQDIVRLGIIPTRVGTSTAVVKAYPITWDHPHACGDKFYDTKTLSMTKGSSPRVWGQVAPNVGINAPAGIIPTRVGTSTGMRKAINDLWDHPHACGDKNHPQMRAAVARGSSPRVWGQEKMEDERKG